MKRVFIVLVFISSCRGTNTTIFDTTKVEQVRFTINDSSINLNNNFKITFFSQGDSILAKEKNDSVEYDKIGDKQKNIEIRFRYKGYDLKFDSIPIHLLLQKQHIALEFGIRDSSMFKHLFIPIPKYEYAKIPGIKYQFFAINPWDSGIGRYFEKPWNN